MDLLPIPANVKDERRYLVERCDRLLSLLVRQHFADHRGLSNCATCGKLAHWRQLQCGHYMSRRYMATRWVFENVGPQCGGCNAFGKRRLSGIPGEGGAMARWLDLTHGPDTAARMRTTARTHASWSRLELNILRTVREIRLKYTKRHDTQP